MARRSKSTVAGQRLKVRKKSTSPWQRFKKFAFTFELTAGNIRKLLTTTRNVQSVKRKRIDKGQTLPRQCLTLPNQISRLLPTVLLMFLILLIPLILLFKDVPSPTRLMGDNFPVSTQIFDRNGALLYEIYADQNRTPIHLGNLPKYVPEATISIEDKNFYHHFGIDVGGVARAAFKTLTGQRLEGGSTITQQLVKMTLLTPQRTFSRKIREAALAIATELIYSKETILELYLNHAPYGGTAYGIEQAARLYFNKSAKNLSLPEAALLAGLSQAPTRYSPFGSYPELAKERQKEVLRRMREDRYITKEEEQAAGTAVLAFAPPNVPIKAPHFVLWIKDLLVNQFDQQTVEKGGLRVTTTLDLPTQEMAEATVSAQIAALAKLRVGNGAALVTNPGTGEILAMVGSQNYFDMEHDGNVNVTLRHRQPGSSIKPLMYATALSLGTITPSTMWLDIPTCFTVSNQPLYCPQNYDGTFHGPVQVRFALGNSYNIPAVKTLADVGVAEMIATASAMGISTFTDPSRYGLSLTLGGGEVTMLDMATAFGTIANEGVKVPLNPFLKIENYKGEVLYERSEEQRLELLHKFQINGQDNQMNRQIDNQTNRPTDTKSSSDNLLIHSSDHPFISQDPLRVLAREPAYLVSHILLDNNARSSAFGDRSQLNIPNQAVSVKTGTTNDLRDNWTIGYTPERLAAVWVGNNNNKPMNQSLVSGVTGAAPIWHDIMKELLKSRKPIWPEKPEGIVGRDVCTLTGLLPTDEYPCDTRHEFFWEKFLPAESSPLEREIWMRKDTGTPVDPTIPLDQQGELEPQTHSILSDPLVKEFCLDCNYPISQELNPDGSVKRENTAYPQSTIDMGKIEQLRAQPDTP